MKQFFFGTLVFFALQLVHGQVPFPGTCPEVKVPEEFKISDYMGVWYEYEKYPFVFEIGRKCMYAIYNLTDETTVSVVNHAINRLTGRPSSTSGSAEVVGAGKLVVRFPNSRSANSTKANYEVLETDYTSYAVVYSCSSVMRFAHAKVIWILTREQNPPASVIEKAEAVLDANKLNKSFLIKTRQVECNVKDEDAEVDPEVAPETTILPADEEAVTTDVPSTTAV